MYTPNCVVCKNCVTSFLYSEGKIEIIIPLHRMNHHLTIVNSFKKFQGKNTKEQTNFVLIISNFVAKIPFSDISLSVVSAELVATIV